MKNYLLVVSACLLTCLSLQGQLSKKEKAIINSVSENQAEAMDFLKETVNINSGTLNLEGVKKVAQLYKKELEEMGFDTEWIPMPEEMQRAGHLFAVRNGKKGKKITTDRAS
ncbi:hypothetical protein [Robertkochia aurantiaca]|uniref:hypothetical protein n=1 Tax=Robertkochia aurantiaca TaxID=2873700 RepID=UPI00351CC01F